MEIFRSISEEEKLDIETHNRFRSIEGQYEGKLFAETESDASKFGKAFYQFDKKPFYIVKVEIENDEFEKSLNYEYPDQELGVGATIAIDRDQLDMFNLLMRYTILCNVNTEIF